eukprot:4184930-Pleurochrysis_carterae.AAC.1
MRIREQGARTRAISWARGDASAQTHAFAPAQTHAATHVPRVRMRPPCAAALVFVCVLRRPCTRAGRMSCSTTAARSATRRLSFSG